MANLTILDLERAADGSNPTIWTRAWLLQRAILRHEDDQNRIDDDLSTAANTSSAIDNEVRSWLHCEWNRHAAEIAACESDLDAIKHAWPEITAAAVGHATTHHGRWLSLVGEEGPDEGGAEADRNDDAER